MYTIEATGWDINKKMENDHLDPGLSISGGRIGKYPGGAVISFINRSNSEKKLKDCDIDDIVFYNPNNKKENVYFVGGINYNSTENEIKK